MDFYTHLENLAHKEAKRLCDSNIEIIGNALDAAAGSLDDIRNLSIDEELWDEDGEDDYERHMRFECRMGNFI